MKNKILIAVKKLEGHKFCIINHINRIIDKWINYFIKFCKLTKILFVMQTKKLYKDYVVIFIDLNKAYDSVGRSTLLNILQQFGSIVKHWTFYNWTIQL